MTIRLFVERAFFVVTCCWCVVSAATGVTAEESSALRTGSSAEANFQTGTDEDIHVISREEPVEFYTFRGERRPHNYRYVMIARLERTGEEMPDDGALPPEFGMRISRQGDFLWGWKRIGSMLGPSEADAGFYADVVNEKMNTIGDWRPLKKFADAYRDGRISIRRYLITSGGERLGNFDSRDFQGTYVDSHHIQLRYYSENEITEDEAREIITSYRRLQKLGTYDPIQEYLVGKVDENRKLADEMPTKIKELEQKISTAQAEMAKYPIVEAETLVELKAKQKLLTVDVAGTEAKVEKCRAILEARANDVTNQFDEKQKEITLTIESLKITAEIELAELSARETALREMITSAEQRQELAFEIDKKHKTALNSARLSLANYLRYVKYYGEQQELFVPLELIDNELEIRPVEYVVQERQ